MSTTVDVLIVVPPRSLLLDVAGPVSGVRQAQPERSEESSPQSLHRLPIPPARAHLVRIRRRQLIAHPHDALRLAEQTHAVLGAQLLGVLIGQ